LVSEAKPAISEEDIKFLRSWAQAQAHASERVLKEMRVLLGDLDAAERVLEVFARFDPRNRRALHPWTFSPWNPYPARTAKAFIWEALDLAGDPWLTSREIQVGASRLQGREIPMSNHCTCA
jgi:hypothetical protein